MARFIFTGGKFKCLDGDTTLLLFVKKWMWISIIAFVMYELYQFLYDVNFGKEMHTHYYAAVSPSEKRKVLETYVTAYTCNRSITIDESNKPKLKKECNSHKINAAVQEFMNHSKGRKDLTPKHSERGFFGKLLNSHKVSKDGCDIKIGDKTQNQKAIHTDTDCNNKLDNLSSKSKGIISGISKGTISTSEIMLFVLMFVTTFISVSVLYVIKYVRK